MPVHTSGKDTGRWKLLVLTVTNTIRVVAALYTSVCAVIYLTTCVVVKGSLCVKWQCLPIEKTNPLSFWVQQEQDHSLLWVSQVF